jgi:GH35 family endo-1,4-beta-xylanase
MLKRIVSLIVLFGVVASLVAWPKGGEAQQDAHFFDETDHWVSGYFLQKWRNTPNALFVLGLPISAPFEEESFTNPGEFYRVQYFERAILEEHPENYGKDDNKYYILGRLLGNHITRDRQHEESFLPVADPGDGSWFPETQHTLRNSPAPFRTFFQNNGALEVFGYPISEQFQEVNQADGETYWVQYFERQRMEWHPNEPDPAYQILLGLLGSEYRDANHQGNPSFSPESPDNPPEGYTPPPVQPDQPQSSDFIYGYNATLYLDGAAWQDRERVLQISKNSQVYWIRQQIAWADIEDRSGAYYWAELDDIVNDVHNAGMKLLITVVKSPTWYTSNGTHGLPSSDHFGDFGRFMGAMAERYKGKVQAYEVWNEQNRACENGGDCSTAGGVGGYVGDASHYVGMLNAAYNAIKAADPNAIVVSGAPTSTETNDYNIAMSDSSYIQAMLSNANFKADAVGVHPGGHNNPPDAMWPDNPGPGEWSNSREFYFRRVEDVRQAMVNAGRSDLPIWITEFGWATANNTPGYEYGSEISYETQAEWIVRAFQKGRYDYPWVTAMFLWNLNFSVAWQGAHDNPMHEQASFSVINPDWSPRPAWHAIQSMPK